LASATVPDAVQAAVIEPSRPARYPDCWVARRVAPSADCLSAATTSATVGGLGGGPDVVVGEDDDDGDDGDDSVVAVADVVGVSPENLVISSVSAFA
jgi:hypothetical protein